MTDPPTHPSEQVIRNLVRLHVYEALLDFDPPSAEVFPHLFAVWTPRQSIASSDETRLHPVHRLCDLVYDYFKQSQGEERPPLAQMIERIWGEGVRGRADDVSEALRTHLYQLLDNWSTDETALYRLKSELPGASPGILAAREAAAAAAGCNLNLLITGETGTGKLRLAQAVHELSTRSFAPLIIFDAGNPAIGVADLLNRLALASGGTCIIQAADRLSMECQTAMLKAMRDRSFEWNARIISLASGNLKRQLEQGRFLLGLYYRLEMVTVTLPALRSRREDVAYIAALHLARQRADADGDSEQALEPEVVIKLTAHAWPRNTAELMEVVGRAMLLSRGGALKPEHIIFE